MGLNVATARPEEIRRSGEFEWLTPTPPLLFIKRRVAITLSPVLWREGKRVLHLPQGFPTDGASLPWMVTWRYDRFDPRTLLSALIHDAGYSWHDYVGEEEFGNRAQVDARFRAGLMVQGWPKYQLYYRAVRVGGWWPWFVRENCGFVAEWHDYVRREDWKGLNGWIANWQRVRSAMGPDGDGQVPAGPEGEE